jgi:DNA-binding transcriptional ArsR family regulator
MGVTKERGAANSKLHQALAHPLRAIILDLLTERTASPNELAQELGEDLANVSYHVRQLAKRNLIELVTEKRRRGAIEHFYKATVRAYYSTEDWEALPESMKEIHSAWVAQRIYGDMAEAMRAGTFESRPDRYLIRTPIVLDEEGWRELTKAYEPVLDQILEVQAASDERRSKTGEPGFNVATSFACFPMPEGGRGRNAR